MSHLRKSDQTAMEHNAGLDEIDIHESGIVLPYHEAPEDEPDEPLSTWLEPQLNLRASTTPQDAGDRLRAFYPAEWIANLRACLKETPDAT